MLTGLMICTRPAICFVHLFYLSVCVFVRILGKLEWMCCASTCTPPVIVLSICLSARYFLTGLTKCAESDSFAYLFCYPHSSCFYKYVLINVAFFLNL